MAKEKQKKQKRDRNGKIVDSLLEKFKSWRLGQKIRAGKLPRGRRITSKEAIAAVDFTQRGYVPEIWGFLSAKLIRANGEIIDIGLVSTRKITTAFRDYIVDSLQDSTTYPLDVFKYHGSGTDNTAEANTQTALEVEVESRSAGTQIEGATANIFKTVATISYTATRSIVEHGLFSAASAGTMMDRSVFTSIGVDDGDAIEFTYEATFNAET